MPFAQNTVVAPEKSQAEIRRMLLKYGASGFAQAEDGLRAMIQFKAKERMVRFELKLPNPQDKKFSRDRHGWARTDTALRAVLEQETRRLWRALTLVIKAKLESVESGIETFEEAFLANTVVDNGALFKDVALPAIQRSYETGRMPMLLLPAGGGE